YERLLDVINETAEQARSLVSGVEQDPIARFEKLTQSLNDAIAEFLEGEPTPLSWPRVNIFVIELSQDHICLTGIGRLMNVFLQKQEDGSYRTFDLFGSLDQPAETDPKKPFASLICGDIKPGDILIVGTTNLERLRNELRIKERLTTLPPVSAAMEIKQDIESRGIPDDFVAAVVACCALEMPSGIASKVAEVEASKSTASINHLRETERDTATNLSPAITPLKHPGNETRFKAAARPVVARFLGLVGTLRSKLPQKPGGRTKDVAAMSSLRGMNAGHGSIFTRKRKRIAIVIGVVLILAIIGFSALRRNDRLAKAEAAWQTSYAEAQDNRNRAESDLVYANDSRARTEIEAAEQALASLDVTSAEHKEKIDALLADLSQMRTRLRKVVETTPVVLATLDNTSAGSLTAPVLVKDTAYAADNETHVILKVDITNKTIKRLPLPSGADAVVAGSLGTKSVVFTTAAGTFYAVNTQDDSVTTLATQPSGSATTDLILYGGRAYTLDGQNGQIWRASQSGSGFGAGQVYIKASNSPLTGAVGLAIDSNVYILMPDGTVSRFLSGGQEGFSLSTIDPPLRAASGIWTVADGTRIAITDPAEKRIAVYNKDGTLKAQLTSNDFTAPRDLDGDEATKRLLVIDGTRLLLVTLP
ncbi:hypothetical protein KJ781_02615, partial [Patescibacteria group bacterium]|nr:hypothetical protein [Patescibacteria group bacterium]MBU1448310.1 hypothetical protein [Patescibacteria group bacterium]